MEEWKAIVGFPNYEVSSLGQVRSIPHITTATHTNKKGVVIVKQQNRCGIVLSTKTERHGYETTTLMLDGKPKTKSVHRLVAIAFIPNPTNRAQVDHIDRNKQNNIVSNLRWATGSENQQNRTTTEDTYIKQYWLVSFKRGDKKTSKTFKTEEEARAFRLAELGF